MAVTTKSITLTAGGITVVTNKTLDTTNVWADASDNTKTVAWTISGATTAKALTLITAHTDNRSITFPDATCTLVPAANPTFTGTVTLPSGSITSSAWSTSTSTFTSGGLFSLTKTAANTRTFNTHVITGNIKISTNLALGAAGGGYPYIGFNALPTASSQAYNYDISDYASWIVFGPLSGSGSGINFMQAASGTGGGTNAITNIIAASVNNAGLWTFGVSAGTQTHAWNTNTAASATAGSNGTLPLQVAGYIVWTLNGTTQKIPYYNS